MSDRLQQAITVLQSRFGSAAPHYAIAPVPARASGIPQLDELTGIGGWPVGAMVRTWIGDGERAFTTSR